MTAVHNVSHDSGIRGVLGSLSKTRGRSIEMRCWDFRWRERLRVSGLRLQIFLPVWRTRVHLDALPPKTCVLHGLAGGFQVVKHNGSKCTSR